MREEYFAVSAGGEQGIHGEFTLAAILASAAIPRMRGACIVPLGNRGREIPEPRFSAAHVQRFRLRSGRAGVDDTLHVAELMAAEAHRFRCAVPNDPNRMVPALGFHLSRGRGDQFPRQHDTSDFDGSPPVRLSTASFGLQDRSITMQFNNAAAL